jgi:hypothetical protein
MYHLYSEPNERNTKNAYNVGELEQWCLCTLGYLKSFSRQYASEVSLPSLIGVSQYFYMKILLDQLIGKGQFFYIK